MTTVLELRTFLIRNGRTSARFNPHHDPKSGKFASKGGGGVGGGGGGGDDGKLDPTKVTMSLDAIKGAGFTKAKADADPPITDPAIATNALGAGLVVHIDPMVLGGLTDIAANMPKSKAYDMSRIRVAGNEQAFEGLGFPRGDKDANGNPAIIDGQPWKGMPQIESQYIPDYVADLRKRGIKVEEKSVDPTIFKASQSQLDAQKAGGIKNAGKFRVPPGDPILVTSDGYVVDGHHRWAAAYAARESVPAIVIDLPIRQGLGDATEFMLAGHGAVKSFGGA